MYIGKDISHVPHSFEQKVMNTVISEKMISPGDKILVGLSGGADSTALICALSRLRERLSFELVAVHVNHHIRPVSAEEDAKRACELAESLGVECKVLHTYVMSIVKETGESIEAVARRERYKLLRDFKENIGAAYIAVAHNLSDNSETVLHNIMRGTTIKGLCGIYPKRNDIIRPLIYCTRDEILEYLKVLNVDYCVDETNFDTAYERNKIRLKLLPMMRDEFNPSIDDTIMRLSSAARDEEEFIAVHTRRLFDKLCEKTSQGVEISRDGFSTLTNAEQRHLLTFIANHMGVSLVDIHYPVYVSASRGIAEGAPGRQYSMGDATVTVGQNKALFTVNGDNKNDRFELKLNIPGEFPLPYGGKIVITRVESLGDVREKGVSYVSLDGIDACGLTLRGRREGDTITPINSPGSKSIKKMMSDKKIDVYMRDKIPLILYNNKIICVVGIAVDVSVRVDDKTQQIIKIKYERE
ncbi:MAG: tRNA lysidine(34) synthetase TilS [Clostridiales bacterium]|nr:tRNA lysidine(34) synthetase TilS [Clostridiales bacterium]